MKKICIYLKIFIFISISHFVIAQETYKNPITATSVASKMPDFRSTKCTFTQNKYMKTSKINLNSKGNFEFIKGEGVIFETTYPVQSTTQYTATHNKNINGIIKAITNKNYTYLDKNFNLYYEKTTDRLWLLALTPKNIKQGAGELISILITGETQNNIGTIKKMEINTKISKTIISFSNCR